LRIVLCLVSDWNVRRVSAVSEFYTNIFVNEAHNDYAQLLVEMGLAGFGVMVWFLVLVSGRRAEVEEWEAGREWRLALAGSLGCVGILVHSFLISICRWRRMRRGLCAGDDGSGSIGE